MLQYLDHRRGTEIVERDDGFIEATTSLPAGYFADIRRWLSAERKAIRLARGKTLDIGAGAGRVALHLQARGHDVVAIDLSPLAVEVCRRRGVRDARALSITGVGSSLGRFDTIVMFGNNFGLFGTPKRARWLLRRFRSLTDDGAVILGSSRDPYDTKDPNHLAYHRRNRSRGRWPGELRLRIRHERYRTPWFPYLIVSPEEMQSLVSGTGWLLREVIDEGEALYVGVIERA